MRIQSYPQNLFWEVLPLQLHTVHPRIPPPGPALWVCRISPRVEEAGPARDELRVPGEEEDGKRTEQDEDSLFSKPAVQRQKHAQHPGLGLEVRRATHSQGIPEGERVPQGESSSQLPRVPKGFYR